MIRIAVALLLAAHGIGHSMGIVQALKVTTVNPAWDGRSWLLSETVGTTITSVIGVALWSVALAGFVVLAGVVMGWLPDDWWAPLAVVSSVASLAGLALFPSAFPTVSTMGCLLVDVVVLAAVFWYHWAPSDLAA
jgi:hypothetical protein